MTRSNGAVQPTVRTGETMPSPSPSMSPEQWVTCLSEVTASFSRWLEDRTEDERIWPTFDRFIRETLLDLIGATRVRLFRVVDGGRGLRPLAEETGASSETIVPTGLMDHVLTTGRRYIRGDWCHGALVDQLAAESETAADRAPNGGSASGVRPADGEHGAPSNRQPSANDPPHGFTSLGPVAWMFGIRSRGGPGARGEGTAGNRPVGLVVVGEFLEQNLGARDGLEALTNLINGFWLHVRDFESLQLARRTDRGSGVLNRTDFLEAAETAATDAEQEGEPVVVMAVAMEGLRRLDDDGFWAARDRLIQETGRALRRKLRNDDLVGRFSDDRFVVLLRWLDLSLGRLIAGKVIQSLREVVAGVMEDSFPAKGKDYVKVRCGLASSRGADTVRLGATPRDADITRIWNDRQSPPPVTLNALLIGALSASAVARRNGQEICIAGAGEEAGNDSRAPTREPASTEART